MVESGSQVGKENQLRHRGKDADLNWKLLVKYIQSAGNTT